MDYTVDSKPDIEVWRSFVEKHPDGNVFHTPEIAEVFQRTKYHKPMVFASTNREKRLTSLILAAHVKTLSRLPSKVAARCVSYGGILHDIGAGYESIDILLNCVDEVAKGRCLFTEIRSISDTSAFKDNVISFGYEYYDYLNYLVSLNRDPDQIYHNFSRSRKQNIKKLEELGISVEEVTDKRGVQKVYEILKLTYSRIQIPLADISLFHAAFDVMYPIGMAKFFLASIEKEGVSAGVALLYKGVIYIWYLGTENKFLKMNLNSIVVWHIIKWGAKNGYNTLDFLGAGRPEEPYGVREFKRRFGGEQVCFGRYQKIYEPSLLKISDTAYRFYRKFL